MDIRSYFSSSSTPSTTVAPSNSDSSSKEERDISPSKKPCISTPDSEHSKKRSKYYRTTSTSSSSGSGSGSIMADECTDVATIEEMSMFCRWEEDGVPEEHFFEIVHL